MTKSEKKRVKLFINTGINVRTAIDIIQDCRKRDELKQKQILNPEYHSEHYQKYDGIYLN